MSGLELKLSFSLFVVPQSYKVLKSVRAVGVGSQDIMVHTAESPSALEQGLSMSWCERTHSHEALLL